MGLGAFFESDEAKRKRLKKEALKRDKENNASLKDLTKQSAQANRLSEEQIKLSEEQIRIQEEQKRLQNAQLNILTAQEEERKLQISLRDKAFGIKLFVDELCAIKDDQVLVYCLQELYADIKNLALLITSKIDSLQEKILVNQVLDKLDERRNQLPEIDKLFIEFISNHQAYQRLNAELNQHQAIGRISSSVYTQRDELAKKIAKAESGLIWKIWYFFSIGQIRSDHSRIVSQIATAEQNYKQAQAKIGELNSLLGSHKFHEVKNQVESKYPTVFETEQKVKAKFGQFA